MSMSIGIVKGIDYSAADTNYNDSVSDFISFLLDDPTFQLLEEEQDDPDILFWDANAGEFGSFIETDYYTITRFLDLHVLNQIGSEQPDVMEWYRERILTWIDGLPWKPNGFIMFHFQ